MSGDFQHRVRVAAAVWMGGTAISFLILTLVRHLTGVAWILEGWMVALVITVVTFVVLVRASSVARRETAIVELMTGSARVMARGDLAQPIDTARNPNAELRELAEAINGMAARASADIGEMKRLERVRTEFLANVSHELRTPIFSVQGYLETLIDGAVDDPAVRDDFLKKAQVNVLRLHTLLTDLIEISRLESGEMKMSFRYFDAVEFFGAVVDELRPTAEMAGTALHFAIRGDGTDATVYGDRERLKQALVNLVENAIKYNVPDGSVTIELEFEDSEAEIRVIDTGIGIPSSDIGRIFERFYRVDKNRSRSIGGSGLGLAITKHIIEAHRSHVRVESKPGVGSTFSFRLKR